MGQLIRFTKKVIENLPASPKGKRDYYEDNRYSHLRLSVTDKGTKSWVVQRRINGQVKRVTLGGFPDLSPENALKQFERISGEIATGRDPQAEKRAESAKRITLAQVFDEFVTVRRTKLKPKTVSVYSQVISAALKDWLNKPLASISKDMVQARHQQLTAASGGPYADSAMRTFRLLWNFADGQFESKQGDSCLPPNPVVRLSKARIWNGNKPRQTYIKQGDFAAWAAAVQQLRNDPIGSAGQAVGDYLMLLFLTGLRRTEAASLTWENLNFKDRTLTITDTKNSDAHTLPLSDFLLELLRARKKQIAESRFVFPSNGSAGYLQEPRFHMNRVTESSGVTFTLHDLRRTFLTVAESLDIPTYTLSRLVNHRMGHSITRDYIITDIERLRAPMQKITDYMLSVANIRRSASIHSIALAAGSAA